ncbi:LPS translocon maturation chaperone LptM [Herbaspirillum sp. alder98]|uniref:LPS translocon maturation chaperone LptM n=1 Tax=Herbaspirillum sp. alder98 TaxID=2913096 RepID=UPI001CD823E7|nr:lipoprotein [Herbaspirillum sp. alder98]MCA1324558.1 lipoprotein [Herbaspirillum sp. alder98]
MKSSISPVRAGIALGSSLLVLALSGCGQKGPLYMPQIPPDPRISTAPKPVAPDAAARTDADIDAAPKPAATSK